MVQDRDMVAMEV